MIRFLLTKIALLFKFEPIHLFLILIPQKIALSTSSYKITTIREIFVSRDQLSIAGTHSQCSKKSEKIQG